MNAGTMKEDFLHFLWQFQLFNKQLSTTTSGKSFSVLKTGTKNKNAGPDFSSASIELENITWAGNIEIHLKSSDWNVHYHQNNAAYENVILHVVWRHDKEIYLNDGTPIPTFELEGKTDLNLLKTYKELINNNSNIPCSPYFKDVSRIIKLQALDVALMQRLEQKSEFILEILERKLNNWEETAYQVLAKNFGFKINSDSFLRLSEVLPLKILQKHSDNLQQIESLLFGQAGLLSYNEDEYTLSLKKEFNYLSHKYDLEKKQMNAIEWKMLRLRPANFPTFRLAQYASFIYSNPNIFSALLDWENYSDLKSKFKIKISNYWRNHYSFNSTSTEPTPQFGKSSFENIVINTIVPLLVAYSKVKDSDFYIAKAVTLLENISAEKNNIISIWEELGLPIKTAFDSQASIELFNNFCQLKKCLSCKIGVSIVSKNTVPI